MRLQIIVMVILPPGTEFSIRGNSLIKPLVKKYVF